MGRSQTSRAVPGPRRKDALAELPSRSVNATMLLAVGAMALVAVAVCGVALTGMARMQDSADSARHRALVSIGQLDTMQRSVGAMRLALAQAADAPAVDSPAVDAEPRQLAADRTEVALFDQASAGWAASADAAGRTALAQVSDAVARYRTLREDLLAEADALAGPARSARTDQGRIAPVDRDLAQALTALAAQEAQLAAAPPASTDRTSARSLLLGCLLIGLLAAGGVAVLLARAVGVRLNRCTSVLGRVRAGDLTARTGLTGRGEVARLGQAVDTTAETIAGVVRQVSAITAEVSDVVSRLAGFVAAEVGESGESGESGEDGADDAAGEDGAAGSGDVVRMLASFAERTSLLAVDETIMAALAGQDSEPTEPTDAVRPAAEEDRRVRASRA